MRTAPFVRQTVPVLLWKTRAAFSFGRSFSFCGLHQRVPTVRGGGSFKCPGVCQFRSSRRSQRRRVRPFGSPMAARISPKKDVSLMDGGGALEIAAHSPDRSGRYPTSDSRSARQRRSVRIPYRFSAGDFWSWIRSEIRAKNFKNQ